MPAYCQVSLRIPVITKARLGAACQRSGQSMSAVLREAAEAYIEQAAAKLAAQKRRLALLDDEIASHPRLMSFKEFIADRARGDK